MGPKLPFRIHRHSMAVTVWDRTQGMMIRVRKSTVPLTFRFSRVPKAMPRGMTSTRDRTTYSMELRMFCNPPSLKTVL